MGRKAKRYMPRTCSPCISCFRRDVLFEILINKVRGPKDWNDFKKFENVTYATYKDACQARGLLEDDKEYIDGLLEASYWCMGNYLLSFYVMLIMTNSMSRPEIVYEKTWEVLAADVLQIERRKRNDLGKILQ